MIDWRRHLGMVPREVRDRVPRHMQWRLNEHMARLALERGRSGRRRTLGSRLPSRLGPFNINSSIRIALFLGWIAVVIGFVWIFLKIAGGFGIPPTIANLLIFGLWLTVSLVLHGAANRHTSETEQLAWQALNRIGIRTCETCGYDCQSIHADRCPECGGELPTIDEITQQAASEIEVSAPKLPHP